MSTEVGSLHYDLDVDDGKLYGQLNAADKKVSDFGDKLHSGLNKAAAGFAVVGAGLTAISKNATDFTVDAVKSAKTLAMQIGTSTEEASRLTAAFKRMGLQTENTAQLFGIFSKNIVEATKNQKEQGLQTAQAQIAIDKTRKSIADTTAEIAKHGDSTGNLNLKLRELNNNLSIQQAALDQTSNGFQKLGITTIAANGSQKDFNTLLFEVADKFKSMPDGIDKTALSMDLFGRSGKDMIKVLNLGSDGIQQLEKDADRLGLTLTADTIGKVQDYIASQKDLKDSTDSLKIAIGTATAPVLTDFNKKLNDIALALVNADGPLGDITTGVLAFGGPILLAVAGLTSFAANLVTAWPAIAATTGWIWGMATAIIAATWPFLLAGAAIAGVAFLIVNNWEAVSNFFKGVFSWISNNWPLLLEAITSPFKLAVSFVAGHLTEIKNAITGFVPDAGHWLYNAGKSIIDGLINGIKDKATEAADAVKNVGKDLINAARSALDWHSPSKVFIEAGQSIGQGLAVGIKQSSDMALAAMETLGNNVISPTLSIGQDNGGAAVGNNTTYGNTTVQIGTINDKSDADYILRRIDRNQENVSRGISPT